ncbi:unnamed protein product [Rotaria sp. Silwood2]|nr:unnamed protein product [Rotaria sp. Silwood2]
MPVAIVTIYQNLKTTNAANENSSIDKLRCDLLKDADTRLLTAIDLQKIGCIVFGNANATCLYGRTPDELEIQGLHVFARGGIECLYDPYAIPTAKRAAAIIKERYEPNKCIVVVDPFLGSGNQLYHMIKAANATAGFGVEKNPRIYQQTMHKNGLIFNQPDLSYKKFSSILKPLILNSSYFSSLIKYIHFDETYSNSFYFPNLKSLKITRYLLSQLLI